MKDGRTTQYVRDIQVGDTVLMPFKTVSGMSETKKTVASIDKDGDAYCVYFEDSQCAMCEGGAHFVMAEPGNDGPSKNLGQKTIFVSALDGDIGAVGLVNRWTGICGRMTETELQVDVYESHGGDTLNEPSPEDFRPYIRIREAHTNSDELRILIRHLTESEACFLGTIRPVDGVTYRPNVTAIHSDMRLR